MTNSADLEANWSGSTLFVKAEYIKVQQDKGYKWSNKFWFLSKKNYTLTFIYQRLQLDWFQNCHCYHAVCITSG